MQAIQTEYLATISINLERFVRENANSENAKDLDIKDPELEEVQPHPRYDVLLYRIISAILYTWHVSIHNIESLLHEF